MANHTRIYDLPSHTKKIFGNIKRVGQGFLGKVTPLFPTKLVQAQQEVDKGTKIPTNTQQTPTIILPTTSQPQRKQKTIKTRRKVTALPQTSVPIEVVVDEVVYEEMYNSVERAATTATGLDAEQDRGIIRKKKSISHGLKRSYKVGVSARVESSAEEESLGEEESSKHGRIEDIDVDDNIILINDQEMFDVDRDLQGEEVIEDITTADIKETVSTAAPFTTDVTSDELTMAQALVEIKKSKPKGVTTTATVVTIHTPDSTRPKVRGVVMQEPSESPTTTTILIFSKVQDKRKGIMVEETLKMKKKDQISFDAQEARRLQAEIDEQDSFDEVQKAFDKTMSWINLFVPMDSKVVKDQAVIVQESSSKRAGEDLEQENAKKQRVEEENDSEELKRCVLIVLDNGDDVTIEDTPLSSKSPTIVDYKIYKEERKSYFQIIRADGNSYVYLTFSKMLKNFNREDLETMFEHHVEDNVWKNQQWLAEVKNWKLFDSYGVNYITMENTLYFLLVEKMYLLTKNTLHQMWNDVRLQIDYECKMAYDLLRLVRRQIMEGYVPQ
nr:hypothetical protein [Tanacetum cinerariifolium]